MKLRLVGMIVAVVGSAVNVVPQAPATFDVASVKVNRSGLPGGASGFRVNGFSATNETLRQLVIVAYGTEYFRVIGGPEWMVSDRFDIQARTVKDATPEELRVMLHALLADRFRLVVQQEARQQPIYELIVNRAKARGLRAAALDACTDRGVLPSAPTTGRLPTCGALLAGPSRMNGRSVTLDLLAKELAPRVGRVVVNRTNLTGKFDIDLEWTAEDPQRTAVTSNPGDPPGIYTALPEQLGLLLRPSDGTVDVVVISRAERPSEN